MEAQTSMVCRSRRSTPAGRHLDLAIAQIVSATNSIRALMPPRIEPPIVVIQCVERSGPATQPSIIERAATLRFRIYRVSQQLAPVPGVTLPTPAAANIARSWWISTRTSCCPED